MAKAYIMALVRFTDRDSFLQNYAAKVADVFSNYDGHFLVRNPEASHKEGRPFDIHVIAEFPSLEKANEALESAEYLEIKKHRVGNSDTEYGTFVVVEGLQNSLISSPDVKELTNGSNYRFYYRKSYQHKLLAWALLRAVFEPYIPANGAQRKLLLLPWSQKSI